MNWQVRMFCCGYEDGVRWFASWDAADRFRNAYAGDGTVGRYMRQQGHERIGIIVAGQEG